MALPGIGYRTAADILMEISLHLCHPVVFTELTAAISPGQQSIPVTSTYAMYPGAQLLIGVTEGVGYGEGGYGGGGYGSSLAELITVTSIVDAQHFIGTVVNGHALDEPVWGATFPTQWQTDPIYTQTEMLGYLSRAQNEFLTAVPAFYELFTQNVTVGSLFQSLPPNAITVERIAASDLEIPITSLSRSGNIVTLTAASPTNLSQYSTFAVASPLDESFAGVFAVQSAPSPNVVTYQQMYPNASTTGGSIQQMRRLYEVTQMEIAQANPSWAGSYGPGRNWFEDRAGLYKWGLGSVPNINFPVELLCAIRDNDVLTMLDQFLVPDVCLHGVKYLALNYAWSKDGIQQQPQMADFAIKRYAQVVLATQRYIAHMKMGLEAS